MKKKIILFWLCIFPLSLLAQQRWTLKDCISYGLKNNRSTQVYLNEKKIADALAKEVLSDHLPKVTLNGTLDNNLKLQESVIPAGVFGPEPTRIAFTQKYNTNLTAQVDQTLFDYAIITGIKAKKYNTRKADLNIEQSQESIIYNISNAYFQVYVYRKQLLLLEGNLNVYRKQIEVSKLQVEKGVILKKDLDKVTVDYNNAVSQIRIAQSNLTLAENEIKYEMGYPFKDSLTIDSLAQRDVENDLMNGAANRSFAVNQRVEYQFSQVESQLLFLDQKRIRAGMYPKLSVYARYGAVSFGNELKPALTDFSPFSVVGLKLNIPILDFFKTNAQYNQAKYKSLNALETLKMNEGKYQMEYENARTEITKSRSNLEDEKRNIELAQSVFEVTNLQYQKGTTDLTDWITAQNSIKEAQNNYLTSLYSFYQAKIDLEKASGTLKTFYSSL